MLLLPRVPERYGTDGIRISRQLRGRRPIHLSDQRCFVMREKVEDFRGGRHEISCQLWKRRFFDDDQKSDTMTNHGVEFIGLIADSAIVGYGDPATLAHRLQPVLARAIGCKVVPMSFDAQAGADKNVGKTGTEIAVSEEDKSQAARS